ncbi:MAG TPA: metal ABC transporter substrate-binding protein [Myxococcota bacterium]|nr:metal ABC transporter substrate-binding protein [Myxococcota bacterium]HRY97403.1 metal ABC transporter substrate-binding protein [Myxococcota bacterium]HSA23289.1 metal ABC transporter substrate-binding protein [Myxococcota bacterium]
MALAPIAAALALLLAPAAAGAALRVVTTLPDFAELARELGGDRVQAEAMVRGSQDPHFVDAKPSFVLALNRADLLVSNGLGLEDGWLPALLRQARNPEVLPGGRGHLDASRAIQARDVPSAVDRSMGDVHAGGNPHYYTSPEALFQVARLLEEKLLELDPEDRAGYAARWRTFEATYRERSAAWRARLAPLQGMPVAVYHRSWDYLLDWAGLTSAGALEPKPGIPPSAAHVTRLLAETRGRGVRQVWQEVYHPTSLSKVFAEKAGARLLVLPSMVGALPGTDHLWTKFDRLVELVAGEPNGP